MHRIAVISTAHIHTRNFLKQLSEISEAEVAVIWDDDLDRGARYAQEFNAPLQPDLEVALNDPTLAGFLVCTENTKHLALLERIIPLGKAIFCEKPIATTTEDAQRIKTLLSHHKTPFHTGYFMPFDGARQAVLTLLAENSLGTVTHVRFRNEHHAAYGGWFNHTDLKWFFDPKLAGGGAFMDLGSHAIHLLITLFGPIVRVNARISNLSGIYSPIDDHGIAFLEFKSGIFGVAEASWIFQGGPGGLEIQGTKASYFQQMIYVPGNDPAPVSPTFALPTRIDRLLDVLDGKVTLETLATDLDNSLHEVAVMEACYRSQTSGTWENVTPL